MGVILYIISLILGVILLPIGMVFGLVICMYNKHFNKGIGEVNDKFRVLAIAFDMYGNVVCAELFNHTLIKTESTHKFGAYGETISNVIGKNKTTNTLTKAGAILAKILIYFKDPQVV